MTKIAIIRIAGQQGLNKKVKNTFKLLNLHKKNSCIVITPSDSVEGMIKVIKDHSTWGEIDNKTLTQLLEKRGKLPGNKKLTEEYLKETINKNFDEFSIELEEGKLNIKDVAGLKPFFRLNPPIKGFGTKGTKKPFSMGGALGYRKENMNSLIQSML
jgi:large subunit ribosomal protein L30